MILKETIDGKEINVIKSSGYNDGYYWDMNATVIFNGNIYIQLSIADLDLGGIYATRV